MKCIITGRKLVILGLLPLLGLALFVVKDLGSQHVEAAGTPSPDIAIAIDVASDGADDCDTITLNVIDSKCTVATGSTFTVDTRLLTLTGLPDGDGDTIVGYQTFDESIQFSGGLTFNNRPGTGEIVGPECATKAESKLFLPVAYRAGCVAGPGEMTFTGTVFEADLTCPGTGTESVTLVHGTPANTQITDESLTPVVDENDKGAPETLTINCVAPQKSNILKLDAKTGGPVGAACFRFADGDFTPLFQVCDNDFQGPPEPHPACLFDGVCEDENPATGAIRVSLAPANYNISESKPPPFYNPDPNPQGCQGSPGGTCTLVFYNAPKASAIGVTKVSLANPPGSCHRVFDANQIPLFDVCDNNFQGPPQNHALCTPDGTVACEDADPAVGRIRVAIVAGTYNLLEIKAPTLHNPDPVKKQCVAAGGNSCVVTIINTPVVRPWFPWDTDGNGAVAAPDFFDVLSHFGECKPPTAGSDC